MEKVGRYQIREEIGHGAMARVFKAYDPEIDRTLAIKLLQPELSSDAEYRQRFLREAKGSGLLSHPNIVTVFDVGEHEKQPYIAMELIEGQTLSAYLKEKKAIPAGDVVEMGIQLAKALDFAHRKGIVHRDVKPGNIMLVKDTMTIKVADFGICRIENSDITQRTQVGNVLGTPHYMSPEQVLGKKVDSRSDLFSAGVVLYELLTGALPFEGETLVTVALKITKEDPVPIDRLRPDLPLSLRRIVDRALKKQPERRFQSGEELANALAGVARELAEAGQVQEQGRIVPLRVRWALIMALVVAVTMSITAAFIYQKQYQAMMVQVTGYGASLARFMATQNAVPLLTEDWAAMEVFIQNTISRQDFAYLLLVDHKNTIRGSNTGAQVGTPYAAPDGVPLASHQEGVKLQQIRLPDRREVLDFATPVVFQGKEIGGVHLGIYQAPLNAAANLTLILMGVLIAVTSIAVALGSYMLAYRLNGPLRVLRNSLDELAKGQYDYRIGEKRNDEFGELYSAFDAAATTLQQRHENTPDRPTA